MSFPTDQPLRRETAVIPVAVDEDEIDDSVIPPRPKWHLEWVPHERFVTDWRPQPDCRCPMEQCNHDH